MRLGEKKNKKINLLFIHIMDKKQEIISKVNELLKQKEKTIRNKNAIEQLIWIFKLNGLYNIFFSII